MSLRRAAGRSLLALLGAGLGFAVAAAVGEGRAELGPPGFSLAAAPTRYIDPTLLGELPIDAGSWPLQQYRSASVAATAVEVRVELPTNGTLTVHGARTLRLERGKAPIAAGCTGALPVVGAEPYPLSVSAAGFSAGGQPLVCPSAPLAAVSFEPGLQRVRLRSLVVDGQPIRPPVSGFETGLAGVVGAALVLAVGELWVAIGGTLVGTLLAASPLVLCGLLAGHDLAALREVVRLPELSTRWAAVALGSVPALLLGSLGLVVRLSRRAPPLAWTACALATTGLVVAGWTASPYAVVPLLAAVGAGTILPRLTRAAAQTSLGSLASAMGTAAVLSAGATQPGARMYFALSGLSAGALVWLAVRAREVRFYNLLSLAAALLVALYLELGVRLTDAGRLWSGAEPSGGTGMAATIESFQALDSATPSHYPSSGYPVRAPEKLASKRVVCLGASSTGGAWQDDDLTTFYPARLSSRLGPNFEAVNQGVGAWTSFHVAHFAANHLANLRPDIVTVYLGVNEGTPAPIPYAELYRKWRAGALTTTPSALSQLRLLNGLTYVVRGLRGTTLDRAVPPTDFADNLRAIDEAAAAAGARVLWMSEAVQPDPISIAPYREVLAEISAPNVAYLDTAALLTNPTYFRDANHLTPAGHEALATLIADELRRLGWDR